MAAGVLAVSFGANQAQAVPTNVEGSAGGGLVPMALMHPQGPLVSYTNLATQNYGIQSIAVGGTVMDRVEVSLAHQMVNAAAVGTALAVDNRINQNIFGLKVKVLDMGDSTPQVAIGLQAKSSSGAILDYLKTNNAISSTSGTDLYAVATKVVTVGGKGVVLNGVLRATKANTMGILGFGGGTAAGGKTGYSVKPELSAGVFLADNIIFGGEYRAKPNNVSNAVLGFKEEGAYSLFMAYIVNKNMTITAAYVNLGQVGPSQAALATMAKKQDGMYWQLQTNF
ncbi:MAG TPA: DUF3034 family protein [Gallionella sp.]|nr:DUF3034 family protein [Gallionella sp.]